MYLIIPVCIENRPAYSKTPVMKYIISEPFSNMRTSGWERVLFLALNSPLIEEKEKKLKPERVRVKPALEAGRAKPKRKSIFAFAPRFCALFLLSIFAVFCTVRITYEYFRAPKGVDEIVSALYDYSIDGYIPEDGISDEFINNSMGLRIENIYVTRTELLSTKIPPKYSVVCTIDNRSFEKLVLTGSCVEVKIDGKWYSNIIRSESIYDLSDESIIEMLVKPESDMVFEPGESGKVIRDFWQSDRDIVPGKYRVIFRVCRAPNINKGSEDTYIYQWRKGIREINDYAYISAEFNID